MDKSQEGMREYDVRLARSVFPRSSLVSEIISHLVQGSERM